MPKRDGYEVAAYVKSRPKLAHIPVVLLTGAFEPIDQARAKASGSSDVLAKPFEPQMVINRVKELLGRKRPDDDATTASPGPDPSQPKPQMSSPQLQMSSPQPANRQQGTEGNEPVSLDDYFDQLDAAFSNLQPGAQPSETAGEMDWPSLDTRGGTGCRAAGASPTSRSRSLSATKPAAVSVAAESQRARPHSARARPTCRRANTSMTPMSPSAARRTPSAPSRRTCRPNPSHLLHPVASSAKANDQSVREPVGRKGGGCRASGGACYHGRRHRGDRVARASAHERPRRPRDGDRHRVADGRAAGPGGDRADSGRGS